MTEFFYCAKMIKKGPAKLNQSIQKHEFVRDQCNDHANQKMDGYGVFFLA